ncbi:MAG: glycosyltransferase, partial [Alphaproteobacteria bacterium]
SAGSKAYEEQLKQAPKFRVLYAGTLGRAHPYKVILNAAAILAQSNPEIEFVFVGDGKGFEKLAQERTRMGLENVRLLPYQPNSGLKEVMESGDVHLISMRENAAGCLVPSKLYSALAVGRPCVFVGPEACEAAKVIEDYRAGEVIPQGDAALLAKVILQFRMNGETWFKAHEGALKAGEVFTAEASIEEWISRANDLIEDIQPPKKFQKFNKNAAGKNIESNPDKEAA